MAASIIKKSYHELTDKNGTYLGFVKRWEYADRVIECRIGPPSHRLIWTARAKINRKEY